MLILLKLAFLFQGIQITILLYHFLHFICFNCKILLKQSMSFFTTPRRRHSSLFQRMENQIKKISNKLSAAKQSYQGSYAKPANQNHFNSFNSIEDQTQPTKRKNPIPSEETNFLKSSTMPIRRKINTPQTSKGQTMKLSQTFLENTSSNSNKIILKLHDENIKLSHRLGKMQQICEDQSYKLGYIKAELKETNRQLQLQKERQFKQNCYMASLLEFYKKKAKKYRKMIEQKSEVSIEISSQNT